MSLNFSVKEVIERKIAELESEFQQTQGLILTEDDLKCLLYKKLIEIPELSQRVAAQDSDVYATYIHTELPWYDRYHKLTIRPDITILEPEHLTILHKYGLFYSSTPSKGCSFAGNAIIFELKFVRTKSGITSRRVAGSLTKDYRKIQRLFRRLGSEGYHWQVFCYFVIFNKTNRKCDEFNNFIRRKGSSEKHKIIYATGNVRFPSRRN